LVLLLNLLNYSTGIKKETRVAKRDHPRAPQLDALIFFHPPPATRFFYSGGWEDVDAKVTRSGQ
jgi:hypothetical protein